MKCQKVVIVLSFVIVIFVLEDGLVKAMSLSEKRELKLKLKEMFFHAYNSYMENAYPADELMPLSCKGRYRGSQPNRGDIDDSLGNFTLTLIDTLDTLAVLGEVEEFDKAVRLVVSQVTFDTDVVVSVFETNIRVLGGLLGGHVLATSLKKRRKGMEWYTDELLSMAKDIGYRLLPAFNTSTGIPYPRVNLRHGIRDMINKYKDTCTACAGTMVLEFAALSRLTGEPIFEEKAHKAMDYLWEQRHRSSDLVGTVINIHNGDWVRRVKRMALDLDVIVDNLYVGSQQATKDPSMLRELGVTHVVTVSDGPIDKIVNSGFFKYKFIEGIDFDITDLLQRFPEVTAFIEEGVKSGAVLVHCVAGVSRSVTMVMAYLMEKNGMSFDDALKLVQQKRKYANPNDGFIKQLKLYEKMKCRLDPSDEEYRVYRLSSLAITMQGHQPKDAGMFLPGDLTDTPTANDSDIIFRCKKCRQPLFNRSCFYKHTVGPGEVAFDWRGASNTEKSTEICDKSIFIHPVQWMKQSIIDTEGKLSCPKCSAKVGSYVWHGEQCPCGEWVIPAFHIQTSKVDECKPIQTDIRNRVEPGQNT